MGAEVAVVLSALCDFAGRHLVNKVTNTHLFAAALAAVSVNLCIVAADELGRKGLALDVTGNFLGAKLITLFLFIWHNVFVFTVPQKVNVFVTALSLAKVIVDFAIIGAPEHKSPAKSRTFRLAGINFGLVSAVFFAKRGLFLFAVEKLDEIGVFTLGAAFITINEAV